MSSQVLLCFLLATNAFGASTKVAPGADWTVYARRFTGESQAVREAAISELKKDEQLAQKLQQALGTSEHFLALDVISALKIRALLPHLMKFSVKDKTGYSYHVINSLLLPEEIEKTAETYQQRLDLETTTPAAKMAILDSLGRMLIRVPLDRIQRVVQDEVPEVRSAAFYFIRSAILKGKWAEYLGFLETGLKDPTYQIRTQALILLSELPPSYFKVRSEMLRKLLKPCLSDSYEEVRKACESARAKLPGEKLG